MIVFDIPVNVAGHCVRTQRLVIIIIGVMSSTFFFYESVIFNDISEVWEWFAFKVQVNHVFFVQCCVLIELDR